LARSEEMRRQTKPDLDRELVEINAKYTQTQPPANLIPCTMSKNSCAGSSRSEHIAGKHSILCMGIPSRLRRVAARCHPPRSEHSVSMIALCLHLRCVGAPSLQQKQEVQRVATQSRLPPSFLFKILSVTLSPQHCTRRLTVARKARCTLRRT
jgi:hypothetical protein